MKQGSNTGNWSDRKTAHVHADSSYGKTKRKYFNMNISLPCHTLQTISIPHELSPWLCTPIFSTLLMTPRGTSTTKGGSWNLYVKQMNFVTRGGTQTSIIHVCFMRVNYNSCLIHCCGTSYFTYTEFVTFWNHLQQHSYLKQHADRSRSLTLSTLLIYILKSVTVSVPLTAPINGQIYITSLAGKQTN